MPIEGHHQTGTLHLLAKCNVPVKQKGLYAMSPGDIMYLKESISFTPVILIRPSCGRWLVKFKDRTGGLRVTADRLYKEPKGEQDRAGICSNQNHP